MDAAHVTGREPGAVRQWPRPREQRRPPSPPDTLPPRRGGGPSPCTYAVSAAGRPAGPARLRVARRGLVRAARALAAAALLALSGALALPAQAQTTCTVTPGDLWCGTLTIGSSTGPGGASHGYIGAANVGSLSPNTFTHEGSTITVNLFIHNVPLMDDPYLALEMSQAPLSGYNFVLDVGSVSINFAGGETSRNFYDTGVDWSMSAGETVTLRLREAPSENATLSGLVVNDGSMDLALIPAFAPATTSYAAWVPKAVEKVTVTPTTLNPNATIEYLDANGMMLADAGTEDGRQVALAAGENVIQVKVTAQDGIATQTYTVTVTRAAVGPPAAPTGLSATADNRRVALAWNAQASDAVITHHEYRYKTDSDYQDNWKTIPYSAPGGFNEDGFTVTGLDNDTAHTFQLRAVNAGGESDAVESSAVTPSGSGRIVESITMRRYDNQDGEPYGIGDKIVFVVVFSEDAECVDSNTRNVRFNLGSGTKNAEDYAGEGTERWWYEYTVQEGDVDSDGIEIPRGPDALPQSYHASLSCADPFDKSGIKAQGPFPDRKVDGVYPSLDSAVVDGAELVLTWNETLRGDSVPAAGDFAVTVAGSSRNVGSVAVAGSAVTLTLASAVTSGQTVSVSYTKGTNPLKDLASNDAPALTDEAVRNSRTAPAAPTNFSASAGSGSVTLIWDAPASDADITRHEYRHKTDGGYPANWTRIPNSAPGETNQAGFTVTGLSNDTAYTFELRAVNGSVAGAAVETGPATPVRPPPTRPQTTNFYLWRTTMTVGEQSGFLGYHEGEGWGELSTGRKFNHPPWSPPHKHHFDPDYEFEIDGIYIDDTGRLYAELDLSHILAAKPGKMTFWIRNTGFEVKGGFGGVVNLGIIDTSKMPDLDWEEDDEVRVVLVYERRLPSAPQNVSVTAPPGEDGTLEVSWEEPEFEGTFPVECYLVEFRHPSGEAKKRKQSYPGSLGPGKGCGDSPPTSVRRTDLETGVQYQVLVQALSGDGYGEWSETKTARAGGRSLRAWFESPPERHDGKKRVTVQVAFSEPIDGTPETVGEHGVDVEGGRVTSVRPVGGDAPDGAGTRSAGGRNAGREDREVVWEFEIEPDSDGDVTVSLDAGRPCDEPGAICTADGLALSEEISTTVEGPDTGPPPLTARVARAPAEHNGLMAFTLRLAFSEPIRMSGRRLRAEVVAVAGGRVTKAKPVNGRKDLWKLTVKPDSLADVTVTLAGGAACDTPGAVCTKRQPRRPLTTTLATTVPGPVALTVADARAEEGIDKTLDFAVSLSRAASRPVRVAYATADGTARAGADYTRTRGTLKFAPGETVKTVRVPVLDDAHDEGEETLTLRLSKASRARLADRVATGTIKNSDRLQRAWLARFGRTAATHVTDAVGDRLRGTPGQDSHLTVGGYRLPVGRRGATDGADDGVSGVERLVLALGQRLGLGTGTAPAGAGGVAGAGGWPDAPVATDPRLGQSRTLDVGNALNLRQVLLGSSFRLALGGDAVGSSSLRLTAWGRVAGTTFDGRDGKVSLDGDVLTGTVGVDGEWDRLLAGLAVAHSRGDGSYTMPVAGGDDSGNLEQTLTSIHPYLRYAVNDRLDVWGLFGYGWGELDLEMDNDEPLETDTTLVMGAFGGRGILLAAPESGGFQLATRTDAMLTRTTSEAVMSANGNLAGAEADAHRLRLVLEGSRGFTWAEGRSLTPTMEVGLRHDWGDAETGFGLELGGRVQYADPALGLTIDATVRGLLAHEDSDYKEWGASGTVRVAPGAMGQGLSLTLAPAWGATASGVDGLWSRQTTAGLAPNTRRALAGRLNAEIGYGVAAPFDTGLLTPYAGTVLSDGADRTYRVGGRLQLGGPGATGLNLNLEGTRQEPAGQQPVNQGLRVQATWTF